MGEPSGGRPPELVLRAEALPFREARKQGRACHGASLRGRHERAQVCLLLLSLSPLVVCVLPISAATLSLSLCCVFCGEILSSSQLGCRCQRQLFFFGPRPLLRHLEHRLTCLQWMVGDTYMGRQRALDDTVLVFLRRTLSAIAAAGMYPVCPTRGGNSPMPPYSRTPQRIFVVRGNAKFLRHRQPKAIPGSLASQRPGGLPLGVCCDLALQVKILKGHLLS